MSSRSIVKNSPEDSSIDVFSDLYDSRSKQIVSSTIYTPSLVGGIHTAGCNYMNRSYPENGAMDGIRSDIAEEY